MKNALVCLVFGFVFGACKAQAPVQDTALKLQARPQAELAEEADERTPEGQVPMPLGNDSTTAKLNDFIAEWSGTPYRMGGMSKKGTDCSGLTINLMRSVYGHRFTGRRAEDLFSECTPLKRESLEEGDLVFFRIGGKRINHVGVYLSEGHFIHASTKRGVIISSLTEEYYDRYFFKGGRPVVSQP
jgi:lipoprotein Spr